MNYLFTSESVSEGHPDKVADQISDAILDEFLRQDQESKVACETFCSTGLVVVGGEVRAEHAYVDIQSTVRNVINRIGYNKADYMFDGNSCGVLSAIHEQSADINRGVVRTDPEGRRRPGNDVRLRLPRHRRIHAAAARAFTPYAPGAGRHQEEQHRPHAIPQT